MNEKNLYLILSFPIIIKIAATLARIYFIDYYMRYKFADDEQNSDKNNIILSHKQKFDIRVITFIIALIFSIILENYIL